MIVFPNAKINLGLNILKKRSDGYHNIQSVFLPINIKDALEVVVNKETKGFTFTNSGLKIDAPTEKNLVVKAYTLLKKDFNLPPVSIHLHKVIPFGAGLGGGSSDASFMFKLLNKMFNLHLSVEQLENYARQIGADCAFFIKNKPAVAKGIGDVLHPINYNFSKFNVIVVKPDLNINTAKVYSYITPNEQVENLNLILDKPTEQWKKCFFNDFEKVIFSRHPQLKKIKNELYKKGAFYASMSGSGSAIFGLFHKNFKTKELYFKHQSFSTKILNN